MTDFTEEQIKEFNTAADIVASLPEIIRDLIRVVEYSISTKTATGGVAAAQERLRETAKKLEQYRRPPS